MKAAVWRIPADFDSSMNEDNPAPAPDLEKLTQLEGDNTTDMKW